MTTLVTTTMPSPVGPLVIFADDSGLRAVLWPGEGFDSFGLDEAHEDDTHPVLLETRRQLDEYFAGSRQTFDLPLAPQGTEFQHSAWRVLRGIPFGATISYGEQARRLGDPNKARAVGAANGRNPIPIIVPCHRVIGATGHLTGFAAGVDTKAWLLDHEQRVLVGA